MDAIELIGAVLSAWAVWLTARRRPWCWPVGLASVVVYAWIFIDARLYSDALLQGAFAVLIVYGWLRWLKHLDSAGRVQLARLPARLLTAHLLHNTAAALALGYAM